MYYLRIKLIEAKRERELLQMEVYNLEMVSDTLAEENRSNKTDSNTAVLENCWRLMDFVAKLDFERVFQCDVMKMQESLKIEREQLEKHTAIEVFWRGQMKNRHVGRWLK